MSAKLARAAILAVGSELLTPIRIDTDSLVITEQLNALGVDVIFKSAIGDNRQELVHAVRAAIDRADLVVLCGGLGPTDDDVTREAVAEVLGLMMHEDPEITARIRRRFESRGWTMPEINRRQAMVPEGGVVLPNANGTAPGLWIEHARGIVLLLPGPPRELKPMLADVVEARLRGRCGTTTLRRRIIRITGRTESHTDEALQPLYRVWNAAAPPITATILASLGQIELHLSTSGDVSVVETALDAAVAQTREVLGLDAYSADGRLLEEVVGDLLVAKGLRIAVAESCTGGLLASRLTDVPGSSRYVDRAVVTYSNESKTALLGVPESLLAAHGAVSEPVAEAMADRVRALAGTGVGIGVTGVAGPGGGTEAKPVGMVCLAVVTPDARRVRTARFIGGREQVKYQASQGALDMLRRMLLSS